jgi:hypothetical protein
LRDRLSRLTVLCESLIKRGAAVSRTSERAYYAHGYFSKSTLHARSILVLVAELDEENKSIDIGAICVLARCIVEIRNASAYLLEHSISKPEAHLRLHLVGLNHATDLLRLGKGLDTIKSSQWSDFAIAFEKRELESNSIFKTLDEPHRKQLLKGRSPFQFSRYSGERPLAPAQESGLYTLLSQSAHSFSLGLSSVSGGGQATASGAYNATRIAIEAAILYLADTALTYCRFRNRAVGKLNEKERVLLGESVSPHRFHRVLASIKAGTVA